MRCSFVPPFSHGFLSPSAFVAYLGFVNVLVAHSHPVMLMFCQLLINRNKDCGLDESLPQNQSIQSTSATGTCLIRTKNSGVLNLVNVKAAKIKRAVLSLSKTISKTTESEVM